MTKITVEMLAELVERGDVRGVAQALRTDRSLVAGTTDEGDTALHIACWQKQLAIVAVIVAYRPDLNARGAYGRTPLHYAVHEGGNISVPIVGLLIALGADPLVKDENGFSVEDWAKIEMSEGLDDVLDMIRPAFGRQP